MMAEDAPTDFAVPQRLWLATVEDAVDKIRAFQQAVIAALSEEMVPTSTIQISRMAGEAGR